MQVKETEHRLRHKLFPPNSWMKLMDFNILTSQLSLSEGRAASVVLGTVRGAHHYRHGSPLLQVLQRPDLIWHDRNGVAHPIMSNEAVARVFRRLADRLQAVVADTLVMTISPEYAAHFLEVYVKRTENAKFTGDRVRFLMLTLPCLVRDLIAPEVSRYSCINSGLHVIYQVYERNTGLLARLAERRARNFQGSGFEPDLFHKAYYMPFSCRWRFQTKLRILYELNKKISAASKDRNSPLFNVPPVVDPSNEITEILVEALEWNMLSREWNV
jgi:hypothetical protein